MRERVVQFGEGSSLVGVLTEPAARTGLGSLPAVILLNAGTLHRIGPHRVYVRIARALASEGFPVLRFDLSGLGDSSLRRDNVPYSESTLRETREAMDLLATQGVGRQFLLMGFCEGGDIAFRVACRDPRVVGGVLIDWYVYRTLGWFLRRYGGAWFTLAGWQRLVRRVLLRERRLGGVMNDGGLPPKTQIASELRALVGRGVDLLYIYTGGQGDYYNYREQFQDAFRSVPFGAKVTVEFHRQADHTLTLLHHQRNLVETVRRWVVRVTCPEHVAPPGMMGPSRPFPGRALDETGGSVEVAI